MNLRCSTLLRTVVTAVALLAVLSPAARAERLPKTVVPSHYALTLTPDLKTATFTGLETIDVELTEPSKTITLNSAEIKFQSVTVKSGGKEQTAAVSTDDTKEETTFSFPETLPAGPSVLTIHYTGILNNELRGFYLSKANHRNYAVTQFESTDARRAFPSFDEPAFKATFDITLIVDKGDTAISNSAIISDTPGPEADQHTLKFDRTVKMSTYLLAFLVGDFQCSGGSSDGVAVRVCATPDKVEMTHYAVSQAQELLHYYDTYFGIHFPLKKLDLIAIPDFEAGAMENFGAITYRETALLIDDKTASVGARRYVAEVIAHEMAHQWFGDLVTMQWWDNIWLNEGFATWMESKSVKALHPEWDLAAEEVNNSEDSLNTDALPTTRAIRAKAETRDEIEQMFDGISYGKAGAVLHMLENYLGEETFRKGVHNYLAAHEYGNATAEDFWGAQTKTSGKPIDKIMESLVAQPGEPLLTFGPAANGHVSVTQQRFYLSPSIKPDPEQKWTLPVCFKVGGDKQQCEILTPETTSLKIPASALFFANAGGAGYYRVAYAPADYAAIVANVETALKPTERISLLGGEWAQTRANKATVGNYLDLVAAVRTDENASVLSKALSAVGTINSRIATTDAEREALAGWLRANFSEQYAKLPPPSPSDSPALIERRARLFQVLASAKDPAVLKQAHELAEKFLADPTSVEPTLGKNALTVAAVNGDEALYNKLQQVYETTKDPARSSMALGLLGSFDDPALARRALDYGLTPKVRSQDGPDIYFDVIRNPRNRAMGWQFVKDHFDAISSRLAPEQRAALVSSASSFCSAAERDDAQQFFSTHKVAATDQYMKHVLESINGCIELRALQGDNLEQWVAAQKPVNGGQ